MAKKKHSKDVSFQDRVVALHRRLKRERWRLFDIKHPGVLVTIMHSRKRRGAEYISYGVYIDPSNIRVSRVEGGRSVWQVMRTRHKVSHFTHENFSTGHLWTVLSDYLVDLNLGPGMGPDLGPPEAWQQVAV